MLLEGIFLPLTTPFHPDGRLFLRKLESNVERYSRTTASGMLVLGREGEGDALTDAETREVLQTAIGAAADEKVMVASVGRGSVAATLELIDAAAEAGYDAIAVRSPEFAGGAGMRLELVTYFQAVADRASLPLVMLGDHERPLAESVIANLVSHERIIGAIDSETSRDRLMRILFDQTSREVTVTNVFAAATRRMLRKAEPAGDLLPASMLGGTAVLAPSSPRLKTRTRQVGFQILAGSTGGMLDAWESGATGAVPRLGACAPQACCEVWQAFKDGDPALAAEKQERIRPAGKLVEGRQGIAALKYGCDLNAYFGGRPRLPLLPLTAEGREAIEMALAGIKN
jgi:dihydrodipicolinate synthase/N-acetylneuraminate lyase